MKIFFLTSEAMPYIKTGGLGDVAGSLPVSLRKIGHQVNLILPLYKTIEKTNYPLTKLYSDCLLFGNREIEYSVFKHEDTLFIKQDEFYYRDDLYHTSTGDYLDNDLRFGFFSRASLEVISKFGGADIIHLNDWQTALLPLYKKVYYPQMSAKTILTIHNLAYQGIFDSQHLFRIDIPYQYFIPDFVEFYGKINFLKGGIILADYLTTVSPTYAKEIQDSQYGFALEGVIHRERAKLKGILNGIDYDIWNPKTDACLHINYAPETVYLKKENKEQLFSELKLKFNLEYPLLAFVGRLVSQKGIDRIIEIVNELVKLPLNLLILGKGDEYLENKLTEITRRYSEKIVALTSFDETLSRKIYASADYYLMPSQFEPCGIGQLIALKYGTVPIVRSTGGLKDTIFNFHEKTGCGNGIVYESVNDEELLEAIQKALKYYKTESYLKMQSIGLNCDYSWSASASEYVTLYNKIISMNMGGES